MSDPKNIAELAVLFYTRLRGHWHAGHPREQFAKLAAAGFGAALVAPKSGDTLAKVYLGNPGLLGDLVATCARTGLLVGGGDRTELYLIPQGGTVRISITPQGWRVLARSAGHEITTRALLAPCEVERDLMGRVESITGDHRRDPSTLEQLEGVAVEVVSIKNGSVSIDWVDGEVIREKAAKSIADSNGRQNAWKTHPIGMAHSRALSLICKARGLGGYHAGFDRLGLRAETCTMSYTESQGLSASERKARDLPSGTPSAAPNAAPNTNTPQESAPENVSRPEDQQAPQGERQEPVATAQAGDTEPLGDPWAKLTNADIVRTIGQCAPAVIPALSQVFNDVDALAAVLRHFGAIHNIPPTGKTSDWVPHKAGMLAYITQLKAADSAISNGAR